MFWLLNLFLFRINKNSAKVEINNCLTSIISIYSIEYLLIFQELSENKPVL